MNNASVKSPVKIPLKSIPLNDLGFLTRYCQLRLNKAINCLEQLVFLFAANSVNVTLRFEYLSVSIFILSKSLFSWLEE